jgi:hypothetical protein
VTNTGIDSSVIIIANWTRWSKKNGAAAAAAVLHERTTWVLENKDENLMHTNCVTKGLCEGS